MIAPMPLRALFVPPAEPSRRRSRSCSTATIYPVERAPASPGAALYAAHPGRDARGRPHHAAARQRARRPRRSRRSTAAGSRRGSSGCRRRRRSPTAPTCRCAACRIASCIGRGARGTVWTETGATASALLCVAGDAPHVAAACAISSSARRSAISKPRAARYAEQLGVAIKRISVRDQSSRWGSCSTTGVLSYSWRLILAPPFVLDYLAAHEVAHLVEMNHSRALLARWSSASVPTAARQGLARRARHRSAPLRRGGGGRAG